MTLIHSQRVWLLLLFGALGACGGGSGSGASSPPGDPVARSPAPDACGVDAQKDFVFSVASDWYLWYDELAAVEAEDFATAGAYLAALTAPLAEDFRDPGFSYLTTRSEDQANFTSGAFVGFGFRYGIDGEGRYRVSDAFEDSPAFRAGFRRGAEILAVDAGDGFVSMRGYEARGASLEEIFGGTVEGLERGFRLQIAGETVESVVTKAQVDVPPVVSAPRLLARPGLDPVAYIHLRNFTRSALPALDDVFDELAGRAVTDFVVDLRYNGGGLVDVTGHFLDLLGGSIAAGNVAYTLSHNDRRRAEDEAFFFEAQPASASPLRIAFITSEATASASESLINSLAPVVEVALIGSDTSGKAVGQYAFDQRGCDTRLRLVAFENLNGDGLGGYYTGLVDTGRFTLCTVEDDYSGAFGTEADTLTAGALAWLNSGICPVNVRAEGIDRNAGALRRGPGPITAEHRPDRRSLWVQ